MRLVRCELATASVRAVPRLRAVLVRGVLLLAMVLAMSACPTQGEGGGFQGFGDGRPDPAGLSCPSATHCYAQADINPVCGSSSTPCLTGFQTQISFPSNVQRGDGYLTQEFWLSGFGCFCWIETGWLVSAGQPNPAMFWAQQTGDGVEFATLATARWIGSPDGSSGRFNVVLNGDGSFAIRIDTGLVAYRATTANPMWDGEGRGYVEMGMELVASSGSATPFTFFQGNRAFTAPRVSDWLGPWAALSHADDPPFGGWLVQPNTATEQGGVFYTQCCLPLYGSVAAPGLQNAGLMLAADLDPERPPLLDEALFDREGTEPTGVPAIRASAAGQVPAFDVLEVATWLSTYDPGAPYEGSVTTAPAVTCPVTVREADQMLPEPTGLATDRSVCVAVAEGSFTTDAPVGVDTAAREPLTADHTFAVIDASTGNLLISGVYRRG